MGNLIGDWWEQTSETQPTVTDKMALIGEWIKGQAKNVAPMLFPSEHERFAQMNPLQRQGEIASRSAMDLVIPMMVKSPMYHHSSNEALRSFQDKSPRSAVYLAETPEGAQKGARAGWAQSFTDMDMTPSSPPPKGKTYAIDTTKLNVLGEDLAEKMRYNDFSDMMDFIRKVEQEKKSGNWYSNYTREKALMNEKANLYKRIVNEYKVPENELSMLYDENNLLPLEVVKGNKNRYFNAPDYGWETFERSGPPDNLHHGVVSDVLKELGYDAMPVYDEAGKSLAVVNPRKLGLIGK